MIGVSSWVAGSERSNADRQWWPIRRCVLRDFAGAVRSRSLFLFSLALLASLTRRAAAEPPATAPPAAGHSWHGETFNDGPRQKAELMGNTGPVVFPATTANP